MPPGAPTDRSPAERAGAGLGLLAALLVAVVGVRAARPPEPRPATVPATEFSAERALRHVEALASEPRPPGTEAHAAARDYVAAELRALGLEVEVQEGWVVEATGSRAVGLYARNLVARLEGEAEGGALLLLTHYDSVPTGPGAGDDACGVAAVLEALRALREGPPLRNDLIVLVTDGEESGLLGARLFVDEHPWAERTGLVLNFEARGNRGPVTLFETGPGNFRLVRAVASAVPYPMGSSLAYEVYRRMPNDTDLTVFLEAGHAGLNFAMIGNHPAYHTELDTPEALDLGSLQHHGSYALGLARWFGGEGLPEAGSENAVYFNPLGSWMLVYSTEIGKLAALGGLLALAVVLRAARSRGRVSWSGLRGGLSAWVGLLLVAPLVVAAVWSLFERLFPSGLATPHGEPYAAHAVLLAMVLLVLAVGSLLAALIERPSPAELLGGILVPWALLGWLVAMFVPGAGYLLFWPAIAATAGLALAAVGPTGAVSTLGLTAGGVVGAALYAPTVLLVAEALGVGSAIVVAAAIALPSTLLLPSLGRLYEGRLWPAGLLAAAGLAMLSWVGSQAGPSRHTPAPTSLFYLLDADEREARWMSYESAPDEWTGQVLPAGTAPTEPPGYLPARRGSVYLEATAPLVDLPGPVAELIEDRVEQDHRLLRVRVRSGRKAPFLTVAVDPSLATVRAVGVEGRLVEVDETEGPVALTLVGLPPEGAVVSIETLDRQPMALDLVDWSWGLAAVGEDSLSPRPESLIAQPRWLADTILVRTGHWF
jgi:hypothetical protein